MSKITTTSKGFGHIKSTLIIIQNNSIKKEVYQIDLEIQIAQESLEVLGQWVDIEDSNKNLILQQAEVIITSLRYIKSINIWNK